MNSKLYLVLSVLVLLAAGGYYWYSQKSSSTMTPSTSETAMAAPTEMAASPAPVEASLSIATDPKLGKYLVGNNGMTVYVYTKDTKDTVTCTGACLDKWPAFVTQGNPVLSEGITDSMVGMASLPNGSKIVTYNHQPLYYWSKDTKPGDITGEGVGGVWYIVSPSGSLIKK